MKLTKYYEKLPDLEGKYAEIEVIIIDLELREFTEVVLYPMINCVRWESLKEDMSLYKIEDPIVSLLEEIPYLRKNFIIVNFFFQFS